MSSKLAEVRAQISQESAIELQRWAKDDEGRSFRRHCSVLLERLGRLHKRGPEDLAQMDANALLRELDLVR